MKLLVKRHWPAIFLIFLSAHAMSDVIVRDGDVSMSREEVEFVVTQWNAQMKKDAANDVGDRLELLNKAMAAKKLAARAAELTPEKDGADYWQKEMVLRQAMQSFMVRRFLESMEVPDMTALAKERYATQKAKYAAMPPRRLTSHLLILCPPGNPQCDREQARAKADQLLLELQAGADFEALVKEHSQDPGSKNKKGRFNKWLDPGMPSTEVDRQYLKATFSIEEEGDYSGVVASAFGFHIIRLDEAHEMYYKSFDEVSPQIIADLTSEYQQMQVNAYEQELQFSDELFIDGDAMEEIFKQYKSAD